MASVGEVLGEVGLLPAEGGGGTIVLGELVFEALDLMVGLRAVMVGPGDSLAGVVEVLLEGRGA